jgi:hypothetical protein
MSNLVKKVTSAVLVSTVVLSTVGSVAGVSAAFGQLDAANKLASLNVIVDNSTNPSAYRLADTVQRQEALKVMMKLSGLAVSEGACTSPFADIANTDWACKYAVAALEAGFISKNATFRPSDEVSKAEALKMVMKARGIDAATTEASWQANYVSAAVAAGIASEFSDYNTAAPRGLMFVWAAEAVSTADVEEDTTIDDIINGLDDTTTDEEDTTTTDEEEDTVVVDGDDMLTVSLNPETPSDGLAQADTARVPLLTFDVKAGSQDVTLNQVTLDFIGLGAYTDLNNVSVYDAKGEKVSKTKSFTKLQQEISFDKDIVVEAGKTMTLTVAGTIG